MAPYDIILITIMNKTKIAFVFAGRLTKEKWFDMIYNRITSLKLINSQLLHKFTLDIYGNWPLHDMAQEIDRLSPNITYHTQVPFKKIVESIPYFDYNLMPSIFLETFGLTAIDFALYGVPTIWFAKWWLKKLIIDSTLDINTYQWESDYDKFEYCMNYVLDGVDIWKYTDTKNKTLIMYKSYSKDIRLKNFHDIVDTLDK